MGCASSVFSNVFGFNISITVRNVEGEYSYKTNKSRAYAFVRLG